MKKYCRHTEYILAGLVSALAFLVYLPALGNGFVYWDDNGYIYDNPHIRTFNWAALKWAFYGFHKAQVGNWVPLTMVSYALDHTIWGLDPMGYHLTNIILHAANTFIVVVLAVRLIEAWEETGKRGREGFFLGGAGQGKLVAGVATGLLFGLHPLHVESVAWASERKDVLCALFFLLGLLFYLRYALARLKYGPVRPPVPDSPAVTYLLSLFLFALALMSKPMAVSLPVVLLLLDWFPLGRIFSFKSFKAAFFEKVPFIVLSAADSVLTLMAQRGTGAVKNAGFAPFATRLLVAAKALVLYLWKMVLPLDLVPFYPYPRPQDVSFMHAAYFLSVLLLAGVTAACLMAARRRKPLFLAAWGYFLATLLPVLGIVQVGEQSMADRYTYLPSLGPFLALGLAGAWAWGKAAAPKRGAALKTALAVAAFCLVLPLSWLTVRQTGVWKNSVVLWDYVIKKEPGKVPLAYLDRGVVFMESGRPARALQDFNTVLTMACARAETLSLAYYNLGNFFKQKGQNSVALGYYNRSISLSPQNSAAYLNRALAFSNLGLVANAVSGLQQAIALDPSNAVAYSDLGNIYERAGKPALAIACYSRAVRLDPDYCAAYIDRALAFEHLGRTGRAVSDLGKAIAADPTDFMAYCDRGDLYAKTGRTGLALRDYGRAAGLDPSAPGIYYGRGNVFAESGHPGRALADYSEAIRLNPSCYEAYCNRGVVLAGTGQTGKALRDFDESILLDPGCAMAFINRGGLYLKLGDRKKAVSDFKKACKLGEQSACEALRHLL